MLGLGLLVRFVFKKNQLSKLILLCVPLLDLALLIATTIDLSSGKPAEFVHGLAAVYLGFTIVYGHSIIQWADRYVAFKFYAGENPRNTSYGWAYAKYEWLQWCKGVLACAIAALLISAAILYIDDPQKTEALQQWYAQLAGILFIWFLGWPLAYSVFQRRKPSGQVP